MNEFMKFKTELEDGVIEFEVLRPDHPQEYSDERLSLLEEQYADLDIVERDLDQQIKKLNSNIDNLTNSADGIDYAVAICCGAVSGLVDVFFVGEFDFKTAKDSVDKAFEDFVHNRAKEIKIDQAIERERVNCTKKGKPFTKDTIAKIKAGIEKDFENNPKLSSSIRTVAEKYKIPTDDLWKGKRVKISAETHHLDDLSHHPTIWGLAASILTQFIRKSIFQNKEGQNFYWDIERGELIGKDLKSKIVCGVINWLGHLISDMAGSETSASKGRLGMGLPGPLVSTLKEFAMLPIIRNTKLPQIANDIFTKEDYVFVGYRMDLRSELAVAKELTRQSIPVFLNEVLLRTIYFIRRMVKHAKTVSSIKDIPWREVLPIGNRTIARMNTISLGTMEVIDITDAALRGGVEAMKAGATGAEVGAVAGIWGSLFASASASTVAFWKTFALRVNYVGIGSFAIAGIVDTGMGIKRQRLISERIALYDKKISVENARLYYKEAEMWISAEKAGKSIEEAYQLIEVAEKEIEESVESLKTNLDKIGEHFDAAEVKNPGLKDDMLNTLKWGL